MYNEHTPLRVKWSQSYHSSEHTQSNAMPMGTNLNVGLTQTCDLAPQVTSLIKHILPRLWGLNMKWSRWGMEHISYLKQKEHILTYKCNLGSAWRPLYPLADSMTPSPRQWSAGWPLPSPGPPLGQRWPLIWTFSRQTVYH